MKTLIRQLIVGVLAVLSLWGCSSPEPQANQLVTFDVGFERFKTDQGIYVNPDGKEEVYFLKGNFNACIKFYDLDGNPTDSISLEKTNQDVADLGRVMVISKDTILIVVNIEDHLMAVTRDEKVLFRHDLLKLSGEINSGYMGSFFPTPIARGDDVILMTIWDGSRKTDANTLLEYVKSIYENRMKWPMLCRIGNVFSEHPTITFGLKGHYFDLSTELKAYNVIGFQYVIANNQLFFIHAHERNIYRMDWETLAIVDTIPAIPEKFPIPQGIPFANDERIHEDMLAEEELREKCRVTNMLYSERKKQYYVFLRVAPDHSAVDELGYPFHLYIYDEQFHLLRDLFFDTDLYNPKAAMMTSRGIMIERTPKDKEYGKRTFEYMDL